MYYFRYHWPRMVSNRPAETVRIVNMLHNHAFVRAIAHSRVYSVCSNMALVDVEDDNVMTATDIRHRLSYTTTDEDKILEKMLNGRIRRNDKKKLTE